MGGQPLVLFEIIIANKGRVIMFLKTLLLSILAASAVAADSACERLKATLTYTQEKAPRDLSSVVSSIHIQRDCDCWSSQAYNSPQKNMMDSPYS